MKIAAATASSEFSETTTTTKTYTKKVKSPSDTNISCYAKSLTDQL